MIARETTVQNNDQGIIVNVPLRLKKRGGRKEVILPQASDADTLMAQPHQEALVIALARAHRWQKLLDEGKFASISDIAREIGLDVSFAARLMRLTLLSPDIVEMVLAGQEPSGLSLTMLTKPISPLWKEQLKTTEITSTW